MISVAVTGPILIGPVGYHGLQFAMTDYTVGRLADVCGPVYRVAVMAGDVTTAAAAVHAVVKYGAGTVHGSGARLVSSPGPEAACSRDVAEAAGAKLSLALQRSRTVEGKVSLAVYVHGSVGDNGAPLEGRLGAVMASGAGRILVIIRHTDGAVVADVTTQRGGLCRVAVTGGLTHRSRCGIFTEDTVGDIIVVNTDNMGRMGAAGGTVAVAGGALVAGDSSAIPVRCRGKGRGCLTVTVAVDAEAGNITPGSDYGDRRSGGVLGFQGPAGGGGGQHHVNHTVLMKSEISGVAVGAAEGVVGISRQFGAGGLVGRIIVEADGTLQSSHVGRMSPAQCRVTPCAAAGKDAPPLHGGTIVTDDSGAGLECRVVACGSDVAVCRIEGDGPRLVDMSGGGAQDAEAASCGGSMAGLTISCRRHMFGVRVPVDAAGGGVAVVVGLAEF